MKKLFLTLLTLLFPIAGFSHSSITLHNNCSSWYLFTVHGRPHGTHCWYASRSVRIKKHHSHKFGDLNHKCSYTIAGLKPYKVKKHRGNVDIYFNNEGELGCKYHHYPPATL